MPERRTPEEIVAEIEAEIEAWLADQAVVGDDTAERNVDAVADYFRGMLNRVMTAMGFPESERVAAAAALSAEVSDDGDTIVVSYTAPERVQAYMDALEADDFDRAQLVLRAREG